MTNSTPAPRSRSVELVELRDRQDQTEVRHRDVVSVDRVVDGVPPTGRQVGDDLMSVQIPVDPVVVAAALFEAEHFAVELGGPRRGRRPASPGGNAGSGSRGRS